MGADRAIPRPGLAAFALPLGEGRSPVASSAGRGRSRRFFNQQVIGWYTPGNRWWRGWTRRGGGRSRVRWWRRRWSSIPGRPVHGLADSKVLSARIRERPVDRDPGTGEELRRRERERGGDRSAQHPAGEPARDENARSKPSPRRPPGCWWTAIESPTSTARRAASSRATPCVPEISSCVDPRQGGTGPRDDRPRPALSGVRLRLPQGLSDPGPPARPGAVRAVPGAPAHFRAGPASRCATPPGCPGNSRGDHPPGLPEAPPVLEPASLARAS